MILIRALPHTKAPPSHVFDSGSSATAHLKTRLMRPTGRLTTFRQRLHLSTMGCCTVFSRFGPNWFAEILPNSSRRGISASTMQANPWVGLPLLL